LTLRNLARHLAALPPGLIILDAGGGSGSFSLPLAQQGHRVCLLDISDQMLAIAQDRARAIEPALLTRVDFCCAPVEHVERLYSPGHFDLVLCHTLLEYLEEPEKTIHALSRMVREGGLLSLQFVTPFADALRWALARQDLEKARLALRQQVSTADLFGLPRRVFDPAVMRRLMREEALDVVAEYGIRIFADYLPAARLEDADFLRHLMDLELAASSLDPYRLIGRYRLMVASRVE
jgi:ubiquinone/menaquinone biosynthesis C-methylase UbiE